MNQDAVCTTALATPTLSNISGLLGNLLQDHLSDGPAVLKASGVKTV